MFKFPDDVHLLSLKSSVDVCLECQVTVLWKLKFENMYAKSIIFGKKMNTNWDSNPLPHAWESGALPTGPYVLCGSKFQWNVALLLQPTAERKLNATWTGGDKLEVGRQWVYGVKQLKCQCWQFQASYRPGAAEKKGQGGFNPVK